MRLTPAGAFTLVAPLPAPTALPIGIAAGPDGNLWFAEAAGGRIGRIDPATGATAEFPLPHAACQQPGFEGSSGTACQVEYLAVGPDGAMWFGEPWRNAPGRADAVGTVTEYPLPAPPSGESGVGPLALGPDGALWFAANGAIGRFVP